MEHEGIQWALLQAGFNPTLLAQHSIGSRYLYRLLINGPTLHPQQVSERCYISIHEKAELSFFRMMKSIIIVSQRSENPVETLYSKAAENYAFGLHDILGDYENGLPLYKRTDKGDFRKLGDTDRTKIFLDEALSSSSLSDTLFEPPVWALNTYLKPRELELWSTIVGDTSSFVPPDASDEEIEKSRHRSELCLEVRRLAFRLYVEGTLNVFETQDQLEKDLGNRERATLLTIIAALCDGADIDISRQSKAADVIEKLTTQLGARVSARTISMHLGRIPDALERRSSD